MLSDDEVRIAKRIAVGIIIFLILVWIAQFITHSDDDYDSEIHKVERSYLPFEGILLIPMFIMYAQFAFAIFMFMEKAISFLKSCRMKIMEKHSSREGRFLRERLFSFLLCSYSLSLFLLSLLPRVIS